MALSEVHPPNVHVSSVNRAEPAQLLTETYAKTVSPVIGGLSASWLPLPNC